MGWLVGCGLGVWSMGRLAIGSLIQLFGGTVGRCVSRLVCGCLEDWLVRSLVSRSVDCSVVWSSCAWLMDGLVGWLLLWWVGWFVQWLFVM